MSTKESRPANPFAHLSDIGITRRRDLPALLGCSSGTITNYFERGILKKLQIGPNLVGVSNADLKAFGERMVQGSGEGAAAKAGELP